MQMILPPLHPEQQDSPGAKTSSGGSKSSSIGISVTNVTMRQRTSNRRRAPSPPPPKYKQLEERTKTFLGVGWSQELSAQPAKLAKAGFYYVGPADRVKCGYCGGKLKKWLPEDSPIEEHVKHFPHTNKAVDQFHFKSTSSPFCCLATSYRDSSYCDKLAMAIGFNKKH